VLDAPLNLVETVIMIRFTQANELKDQGNKAFQAKDYDTAIDLFTKAIELDPQNHVLFSNRSAAKAGKKQWDAALEDAETVCGLLTSLRSRFGIG
jgi:tetratricopeptide (TPR) repeat protein